MSTDPAELSLHNLEAMVEGQRAMVAKSHSAANYANLTALLIRLGTLTGNLSQYEEAASTAAEMMKLNPKLDSAWETKAAVDSTYHRFADALTDYATALKLGDRSGTVELGQVDIEQARGTSGDAVYAFRKKAIGLFASIDNCMMLALAEADRGNLVEAKRLFGEGQAHYRDISPFPLATLYFQEGLIEQRSGSPARARELFAAAHERVPQYKQATSHLASVLAVTGDKAQAIKLLEPLATADDPEYEGQLAALLDETDAARATKLRADATTRYEALLKKYPLAFADHAARFYLSGPTAAQNPKRALELSRINAKNRPTTEAQRLLIDAAIAAGDTKLACATADTILKDPHLPPEAHVSAARAYTACGQKDRASAEVARVTTP